MSHRRALGSGGPVGVMREKGMLELFLRERSDQHSWLYRYAGECFGGYVS